MLTCRFCSCQSKKRLVKAIPQKEKIHLKTIHKCIFQRKADKTAQQLWRMRRLKRRASERLKRQERPERPVVQAHYTHNPHQCGSIHRHRLGGPWRTASHEPARRCARRPTKGEKKGLGGYLLSRIAAVPSA